VGGRVGAAKGSRRRGGTPDVQEGRGEAAELQESYSSRFVPDRVESVSFYIARALRPAVITWFRDYFWLLWLVCGLSGDIAVFCAYSSFLGCGYHWICGI